MGPGDVVMLERLFNQVSTRADDCFRNTFISKVFTIAVC